MHGIFTRLRHWLFPPITEVSFSPEVRSEARRLAYETHPKEMIAALSGEREGKKLLVSSILYQPFSNTRSSATIYMDAHISGVVGTIHSHPTPDPRPSAQDKRHFAQHGGVHAIIAYPYDEIHVYNSRGVLVTVAPVGQRGVPRVLRARARNR